jgi:hypothetical protein
VAVGVADDLAVLAELFDVIEGPRRREAAIFHADPTAILIAWSSNAEKGHVYLCDERGVRTGTSKALRPGESAEEVARQLLKDEVGKKTLVRLQ